MVVAELCGLSRRPRPAHDHCPGRAGVGPGIPDRQGAQRRAAADDRCPQLRPLPGRHRPEHRSAATAIDAELAAVAATVHLRPQRHRDGDAPGPHHDRVAASGGDLRHADRAARGQRATDRRGDQARPQRHRLGPGRAANPGVEVREVPAGSAARQQHAGAHRIRRPSRGTAATPHRAQLLHLPDRHQVVLRGRVQDIPASCRRRRHRGRCTIATATARPSTHVRRSDPARLVSQRRGRPRAPELLALAAARRDTAWSKARS